MPLDKKYRNTSHGKSYIKLEDSDIVEQLNTQYGYYNMYFSSEFRRYLFNKRFEKMMSKFDNYVALPIYDVMLALYICHIVYKETENKGYKIETNIKWLE